MPLAWVQLPHQPWACFPNGSVFDPSFHALWLPAAMTGLSPSLPHLPQRLTADLLADLVALHRAQAGRTVTLFQLLGAGATVGHCHAQSVAKPHTLPIELAGVRRAGPFSALADYPARGLVFNMKASDVSGCGALWRPIDKLQSKSHPYNLILIRDEAYLIVRNPEHIIVQEWSGVLAGMELCGRAITHSAAVFDGLTRPQFAAALTKTTLPADDVLKLLGVP